MFAMPGEHRDRSTLTRRLWLGGLLVTGAAGAGIAAHPAVQAEAHRLRRFVRPVGPADARPPIPPWLPEGYTAVLPGRGEVFYRDTGPAPGCWTVLLNHGWVASADLNFLFAYGPLSQSYRVVALDHRGHGRGIRSDAPFTLEDCADDAAALLSVLGAGPAVVVGYSMGGPVSLLMAARHPDLVAGLVLEATAAQFGVGRTGRLRWLALGLMELALRKGTDEGFVYRILREAIEKEPSLEPLRPWLAAEFRRGLGSELVSAGRALSSFDARPFVGSLGMPAVSVVTRADRLVPPRRQKELAAAMGAPTLDLPGDHDSSLVDGQTFGLVTKQAVARVVAALGSAGHVA